jgi:hypothetical protein
LPVLEKYIENQLLEKDVKSQKRWNLLVLPGEIKQGVLFEKMFKYIFH